VSELNPAAQGQYVMQVSMHALDTLSLKSSLKPQDREMGKAFEFTGTLHLLTGRLSEAV